MKTLFHAPFQISNQNSMRTDERKALSEDMDRISRKAEDHALGRMVLAVTLVVLFLARSPGSY